MKKTFTIDYRQFVAADGTLKADLPKNVSSDKLIQLYQDMVLTRIFDQKAINLQRTGKMGTYASCLGQEGIAIPVGHAMQEDDILAPSYREYGIQFQRGVKMLDILNYWGGDERGSDFHNPYDFPISVPIASQCLHAAGAAKAIQIRGEKRAVVSVCGDGATSQGDFYEAMNVAGTWKLPVVFLVCNNQWAISVPRHMQSGAETLAQKAIAAGIPGLQIDGNDALCVYDTFVNALAGARAGNGPQLIEAITYRLHDHTTADDATRYRSKEEVETAWQNDPVKRLRIFLTANQLWDDAQQDKLEITAKQKVEESVAEYLRQTKQPVHAILDYMYARLPEAMLSQYEDIMHYAHKEN